jgi:hypothetical protein
MDKMQRKVWSLKELDVARRNVQDQGIDRRKIEFIPMCKACGVSHGKNECKVVLQDGAFYCIPKGFAVVKKCCPALATVELFQETLKDRGIAYGQGTYPLSYGGC